MAVENDTDRSAFVNTDEFGESFTVGASSFNAIIDNSYNEDDRVESNEFVLTMRTVDVTSNSITRDTTVTRDSDSQDYKVREIQNDGTGMSMLVLEEQ